MTFYRSVYKGSHFERAVSVALRNRGKGSEATPIYLEKDGIAIKLQTTEVPSLEGKSLVTSNGMKEFLDVKLSKDEIDSELGDSNTSVSSQKAIKEYVTEQAATKQNKIREGKGLDINTSEEPPIVSITEEIFRKKDNRLNEELDYFPSLLSGNNPEVLKELKNTVRYKTRLLEILRDPMFSTEGTIEVSDDCIVTDFSEGLVSIPYNLKSSKSYRITGSFTLSESLEEQTILYVSRAQDSLGIRLYITEEGIQLNYYNSRSSGGKVTWSTEEVELKEGNTISFDLHIEGSKSYCSINEVDKLTKDLNYFSSDKIVIGSSPSGYPFKGSIDLNYFKIFEGGQLKFQASLVVPYYISVNGKRVVKEEVLPRIIDVYNQIGYSVYFALAKNEYILPTIDIQETTRSFVSGCSYYNIRADHVALQQGTAQENERVNFLVPFKDASYSLTIPYSSKDERGFIPAINGDWMAKGKVKVL